jgi:FlaA1/EpsC-like NDP-sugar epimerase
MLDTNVVKSARLLEWLAEKGETRSYFCVSTDKAANPVNLMGASKRLMEHVIFSGEVAPGLKARVTSARFANVAFSDGSLLHGFLNRLQKRQPLAVPRGTRRFFISLREAGQICLLAAICAPDKHLLIPRLDPAEDLHDLEAIAVSFLRYCGYEPRLYDDEAASQASFQSDVAQRRYPLLVTRLDTSGEKPYEEFVAGGEQTVETGMAALLGIPYQPAPPGRLKPLLEDISQWLSCPERIVTKKQLVCAISAVVAELRHIEREKSLDSRM